MDPKNKLKNLNEKSGTASKNICKLDDRQVSQETDKTNVYKGVVNKELKKKSMELEESVKVIQDRNNGKRNTENEEQDIVNTVREIEKIEKSLEKKLKDMEEITGENQEAQDTTYTVGESTQIRKDLDEILGNTCLKSLENEKNFSIITNQHEAEEKIPIFKTKYKKEIDFTQIPKKLQSKRKKRRKQMPEFKIVVPESQIRNGRKIKNSLLELQ